MVPSLQGRLPRGPRTPSSRTCLDSPRELSVLAGHSKQTFLPPSPLRLVPSGLLLDHGDEEDPCDRQRAAVPKEARDPHDISAGGLVSCGQQSGSARMLPQLREFAATSAQVDPGSSVARQTRPGSRPFPMLRSGALDGSISGPVGREPESRPDPGEPAPL